jgi:4-hydroxy-tetrahydrodipicolinate reductase
MSGIKIMVNGLPGNMAATVARHAVQDGRFELIPWSFTGPEVPETRFEVGKAVIRLISPAERDDVIPELRKAEGEFISIDYTHPSAVLENARFYCRYDLPFVMGTTGGDRTLLEETVRDASVPAVIAPNMAKQIVGFQAMLEYAADNFPELFTGYTLEVRESHQKGKADTSGTARAVVSCFNSLGVDFPESDIRMERDPEIQRKEWGIPEKYLGGHGWHTYTLLSEDGTVKFAFTHNVNGRDIYARGTLDAVSFLSRKIKEGASGRIFTMIDVLKG